MKALGLALALAATTALATPAMADPDITFASASRLSADHVMVVHDGDDDAFAALDDEAADRLREAIAAAAFEPKMGKTLTVHAAGPYKSLTVIGAGEEALKARDLHDLGGHAAKSLKAGETTAFLVDGLDTDVATPAAHIAMGAKLGGYTFTTYKSDAEDEAASLVVTTADATDARRAFGSDHGQLADAVNLVRDLGNSPGRDIYPESFVQKMREAFRGVRGVNLKVYELDDLERMDAGGIVGVGQGSVHDPRMLVVEYMGGGSEAPIALVGKGITFDTGGISLKGNNGMWLMKSDLSGAAAVGATVLAAAKRGADVNLVAVMPLAENMPADNAIRPGDVLTTYNGTTIEVISTDAEGRLLLADAVAYAQDQYDPELLVNIATLTGSAGRALGDEYAAVVTRDFDLARRMMEVGEAAGEEVWPLPLHPNHYDQIKSDIADIKGTAGAPGASIGAAVVGTFVEEDQPWIHIDMASVDWRDSATPTAPKGHAGWGVRFLDQLIRELESE